MSEPDAAHGITPERLRALPRAPGVYLMKDADGEVLYVGKAKNLHARVRSYFTKGDDGRYHLRYLMERIDRVDTLVTEDERQALVLENDLIKKYKPRYNVRLKDDKAHLLVRVDQSHEWPRLELVRHPRDDGARYIGPFAFSYELRAMLDVINRSVPLRTCSDSVIYNRVRPCLEYQIKRCAAPCCLPVSREQYAAWVEQAISILQGNTAIVVTELTHHMERASEELRFEDAATYRDRIQILQRVGEEANTVHFGDGSADAFGLYREGNNLELSVLVVRQGRLYEARTFGFSDTDLPTEELLGSLLSQYYAGESRIPEAVVLPLDLEDADVRATLLSERRGKKVELKVPQRGSRARLLALANQNAKENFEARFSEQNRTGRILKALQVELGLEQTPQVIECVDISHFQGGATVGTIVCFEAMKPLKARYRTFNLSQEGKPDDFASMREVALRHLSRGAEENTLPDLLVVDGGLAQLNQALEIRRELGLLAPAMIGLAKKRTMATPYRAVITNSERLRGQKPERIYVEGAATPIVLNPRSEALQLLERIRNEAHRFAITTHRKKRSKKTFRSALDAVPGIGATRRSALLKEFGSVKRIKEASAKEISQRCGFPLALSQRVLAFLDRSAHAHETSADVTTPTCEPERDDPER
ncbi:MAG: excinuclease ABC subunit UvrC [Bdellovibrionales bacterium]|nr:excinuclease ABC subunit UvrC [Bdellovibrionales bacterium]